MENEIGNLEENALIRGNYHGNFPAQMPIYLIVDWEYETIYVCTRNDQIGGIPARQWNGFEYAIGLPANIDAEKLASDIDQYYLSTLDKIRKGWSKYYDGNNYKGQLTEEARELLWRFEQEIGEGGYLSTLDEEKHTEYLIDAEIIDEEGNPY